MSDARDATDKLAELVAEGQPVDWNQALRSASDERERRLIGHLRVVESVAKVHRSAEWATPRPSGSQTVTADPAPAFGSWAHLELREKLGEGSFGEVYRALDRRLDREVAVKLLKSGASKALEEGRLLAKLRHPNVVTVYGAEVHAGRVGLWMELIRGRSLEQLLNDQGPFGAREASLIGIELCRALAAVHGAGVIHRDVKAQNAMREEGGRIILTDFGAGFDLRGDAVERASSLSGTPYYMASELFRGEAATQRSDIYSLGVLLYHLVTRSFPVQGATFQKLSEAHKTGDRKLLRDARSDLPPAFVQAVEKATEREPAQRFATAGALEAALTAALGAVSESTTDSGQQMPRRNRTTLFRSSIGPFGGALAGALVLFVVGLLGYAIRGRIVGSSPRDTDPPVVAPSNIALPSQGVNAVVDELGRKTPTKAELRRDTRGTPGGHETATAVGPGLAPFDVSAQKKLAESLVSLAALKEAMGVPADAQVLYRRALSIQEKVLASDDPDLATTLTRLGNLFRDSDDFAQAEPLLTRAVLIMSQRVATAKPDARTISLASLAEVPPDAPPYSIEAALYRKRGDVESELSDGDQVGVGDHLFLRLRASAPLYAYVVSEDEAGHASRLFPMPGFDVANPLAPGVAHRIPGRSLATGLPVSWQVDTAGGREHMLVVTSPIPLDEFEADMRTLAVPTAPANSKIAVAESLSPTSIERLRGIGALAEEETPPSAPKANAAHLFELARRLSGSLEKTRGVWIRQIDLVNPKP